MGDVIDFGSYASEHRYTCKDCVHLQQMGNGNILCDCRVHMDGSDIYPVLDGHKTSDWGACDGEFYEKTTEVKSMLANSRSIQIVDTAHGMHKRIGER